MTDVCIRLKLKKCTSSSLGVRCPFVYTVRTEGAGCADDYWCRRADKKIAGYVEWDSDIPKVPDWCPCRE